MSSTHPYGDPDLLIDKVNADTAVFDGVVPTRIVTLEEAEAIYGTAPLEAVESLSDDAVETAVKQGDLNWHRRDSMEKQLSRFQMRQQLEQQAAAKKREKALAEWRRKPNADRISFEEVKQVGEETGHRFGISTFNLAIRGAMRQQGYLLGMN